MTGNREIYFAPKDDTHTAFVNLLKSAQDSLDVCIYSFDFPEIPAIIEELLAKQVKVRFICDISQSLKPWEKACFEKVRALLAYNLHPCSSEHHADMHHKYVIVDGAYVLYGSWNFTTAAVREDNFFMIDSDPLTVAAFAVNFEANFERTKAKIAST